MKKLLIVLFIILPIISFSQEKFDLGVKTGINFTTLLGDGEFVSEGSGISYGYVAGLDYGYLISNNFSLRSGLEFKKSQIKNYYPTSLVQVYVYSDFNYISIPLKFRISTNGKTKMFFEVGASANYLLKQFYSSELEIGGVPTYLENTDNFNRLDYGLLIGFGISYYLFENLNVSASLNDEYFLNKINNDIYFSGDLHIHNIMILIGANYSF